MQSSGLDSSDIIVIGAGGCGLMAALVAARKGAPVLVLEKTDKPGGGTAYSSKGIRAAGTIPACPGGGGQPGAVRAGHHGP